MAPILEDNMASGVQRRVTQPNIKKAGVQQRSRTADNAPFTRQELYQMAQKQNIPGRSTMGRAQLARALHVK